MRFNIERLDTVISVPPCTGFEILHFFFDFLVLRRSQFYLFIAGADFRFQIDFLQIDGLEFGAGGDQSFFSILTLSLQRGALTGKWETIQAWLTIEERGRISGQESTFWIRDLPHFLHFFG